MISNIQDKAIVWETVGGPAAGTISAMVIATSACSESILFIGTKVGLYRSTGLNGAGEWQHLTTAPVGVMALAASPDFEHDHTLIAGSDTGIFISIDAGESWRAARIPFMHSMILSLAFSPDFAADGIVIAGTLEDGVWVSRDRGESWHLQSFGLLDSTILSLAVSPGFANDGTIFAGTDTAVYFTYNQARAWKQMAFPDNAAPVLAMAVSAGFDADGTIYAGTEQDGMYCSIDRGDTWEKLTVPANSVNAVLVTANNRVIAATDSGIFASSDVGATWSLLAKLPNTISLVNRDEMVVAGLVEDGVWMSLANGDAAWRPIDVPSIRTMYGLVLSPDFVHDQHAYMCGLQEGVWRSTDGGATWENVSAELPTLDIYTVKVTPSFAEDRTVLATSPDGLYLSQDAGDHWQTLTTEASGVIAFSPDGKYLCASFQERGIRLSADAGQTWETIPGPWDTAGKVVQLAISNTQRLYVALLAGVDDVLTVWQGESDPFEQVLAQPTSKNPVVSMWVPPDAVHKSWYVALGNRLWRFSTRAGAVVGDPVIIGGAAEVEDIVALTGVDDATSLTLVACSSHGLFRSTDARTWTKVGELTGHAAVAFVLSPAYWTDRTGYALLLGGTLARGVIQAT